MEFGGKSCRHHFFSNTSRQDVNAVSSLSHSEVLRFCFSKTDSISSIPVNAGAHACCPKSLSIGHWGKGHRQRLSRYCHTLKA